MIIARSIFYLARIIFKGLFLKRTYRKCHIVLFTLIFLVSCTTPPMLVYHDPNMDFLAIKTIAVMPFENLSDEKTAADRVRDVLVNMLLATGEVYALPPGEVSRGATRAGISTPASPSIEEIIKFAAITKVNAVITGVIREYGTVRSGTSTANIISFSLQMIEGQSGRIIWTASTSKGGIGMKDRLLGGGGQPMNDITEEAVNDILKKYF